MNSYEMNERQFNALHATLMARYILDDRAVVDYRTTDETYMVRSDEGTLLLQVENQPSKLVEFGIAATEFAVAEGWSPDWATELIARSRTNGMIVLSFPRITVTH